MRRAVFAAAAMMGAALPFACGTSRPAALGDSDAAIPKADSAYVVDEAEPAPDAVAPALDSSFDAGVGVVVRDYAGVCGTGQKAVWHFFDFQTHTPQDSSISFTAQTSSTQLGLATAVKVPLATVTGPDITVWTGIDVDAKLTAANQQSLYYLRITIVLKNAGDGTPPVLNGWRQLYDCIQIS